MRIAQPYYKNKTLIRDYQVKQDKFMMPWGSWSKIKFAEYFLPRVIKESSKYNLAWNYYTPSNKWKFLRILNKHSPVIFPVFGRTMIPGWGHPWCGGSTFSGRGGGCRCIWCWICWNTRYRCCHCCNRCCIGTVHGIGSV